MAVPKNKISKVPLNARVGVLMKTFFLFRPLRHVEAVEISETRERQRIKIDIPLVPVGRHDL